MAWNPWLRLLVAFIIFPIASHGASLEVQTGGGSNPSTKSAGSGSVPASPPQGVLKMLQQSKPVDLDSRNFGSMVGDGSTWLVEFYSTHCKHCVEFAPTYEEIAKEYHTPGNKHKIRVGRVNGEVERALMSRFPVTYFPSFYLIDGFSVYLYKKMKTKRFLMHFAEGGYKEEDPIPFYESPMGPTGLMQGMLTYTGVLAGDFVTWCQDTFGFSELVTCVLLFGGLFFAIFFTIIMLALATTPKLKPD